MCSTYITIKRLINNLIPHGSELARNLSINVDNFRIYTFHLANTFMPTICLIIIAEITLFIDVSHFEATMMVALTSMLVMYTLYQSISATLPQTGKKLVKTVCHGFLLLMR